jgi:hypothetical protein
VSYVQSAHLSSQKLGISRCCSGSDTTVLILKLQSAFKNPRSSSRCFLSALAKLSFGARTWSLRYRKEWAGMRLKDDNCVIL